MGRWRGGGELHLPSATPLPTRCATLFNTATPAYSSIVAERSTTYGERCGGGYGWCAGGVIYRNGSAAARKERKPLSRRALLRRFRLWRMRSHQPPPGVGAEAWAASRSSTRMATARVSAIGADTTGDTLLTFNIPVLTPKAVGDRIRIFANGIFAASTDSKTARIRYDQPQRDPGPRAGNAAGTTVY